jgi:transposase
VGGKKFLHKYNVSVDALDRFESELMTTFRLGQRERQGLQELLTQGPFAKKHCRIQALLWLAAGESPSRIADLLGVSRRTVYYWAERFQDGHELDLPDRVADGPRSGRPPTVAAVLDPLLAAVIDLDPRQFGYRATGWTNALLRHYLAAVHHQAVSRKSVSLALARLGIGWKRPRHDLALRPDTWRQAKGGSNAA